MKLLVVLVNYNGFQLTADCLDSIAPMLHEVPGTAVGVCDNGSRPGTPEQPGDADRLAAFVAERGYGQWCTLTNIHPNLGFTGGNNAVIRPALESDDSPEFVLLLNNDTLVRPGAFRELVDFLEARADVGLAGSRLEDPDGTPQVSAFRFFNLRNEFETQARFGPITRLVRGAIVPLPVYEQPTEVDWVAGASLLIRREVIDAIGPLDDDYYTYFDDIDLCHSAKKAGWPTWYVPASRVVHLVGQTTGITHAKGVKAKAKRRPGYWFQARRRYWLKHHGFAGALAADAAHVAGLLVRKARGVVGREADLPDRFLRDFLGHSAWVRGGKLNVVENPALQQKRG